MRKKNVEFKKEYDKKITFGELKYYFNMESLFKRVGTIRILFILSKVKFMRLQDFADIMMLSCGVLHPCLNHMISNNLIVQDKETKVYSITDEGKKVFDRVKEK